MPACRYVLMIAMAIKARRSLGAEVTGGCERPDVSAKNSQVLWKSNKLSQLLGYMPSTVVLGRGLTVSHFDFEFPV